jgi:hypothetical protein
MCRRRPAPQKAHRSEADDGIRPDRSEAGSPHIAAVKGAMTNAATLHRGIV